MERYESYKDSGVAWIDKVPSHWEIIPLKRIMQIRNGQDYKLYTDNDRYPVIGSGGCFAYCSKYLYDGEALLLGRKGTIDKPLYIKGRFWVVDTMFYAVPKILLSVRYCYYQALTIPFEKYSTSTALPSMTQTDLGYHIFCLPPFVEQQTIVAYLDKRCSEIDKAIATQQKRIALLQELKQSIITHAVTRGIHPDVPLKESGVEWIGKVPEHWDIKRMRFLCTIDTGTRDTIDKVDDGDYPFYVRSPKIERINTYTFDGEAVLMAGDGVGAGKVIHYANGKFDYHQRVYNIHNYKEIATLFAYYYLQSNFRYKIEEGGAKNTVDSVRLPWLKDFPVCIPPQREQDEILTFIKKNNARINTLILKAERQIELLQELRQSVITEAITGKIKVC